MKNRADNFSARSGWEKRIIDVVTILFLVYLFIPLLAMILFSFAGKWNSTVLPEVWSIDAYTTIFMDDEFCASLLHSLTAAFCVVLIDITVVVLALFSTTVTGNKKMENLMEALSIIPVALPGIVMALGIIKFYGVAVPRLLGTPFLLIMAQAGFSLPLCFWTLKNVFANSDIKYLYQASCTLGVPTGRFLLRILLPGIKKGIFSAAVMAFTSSFNDFALAQLIVGARWQTLPILQNKYIKLDGHLMSAMAVTGNLIIFLLLMMAAYFNNRKAMEKRV